MSQEYHHGRKNVLLFFGGTLNTLQCYFFHKRMIFSFLRVMLIRVQFQYVKILIFYKIKIKQIKMIKYKFCLKKYFLFYILKFLTKKILELQPSFYLL